MTMYIALMITEPPPALREAIKQLVESMNNLISSSGVDSDYTIIDDLESSAKFEDQIEKVEE